MTMRERGVEVDQSQRFPQSLRVLQEQQPMVFSSDDPLSVGRTAAHVACVRSQW